MATFEAHSTLFRGELKGATGDVAFKLTADAIDAVDTVNFQGNAITYKVYTKYSKTIGNNATFLTINFNVPEAAAIEILVHAPGMAFYRIDGVAQSRWGFLGTDALIPWRHTFYDISPGNHTLKLVAGSQAGPSSGYVLISYIRPTGG
jgi:hypothetical protein